MYTIHMEYKLLINKLFIFASSTTHSMSHVTCDHSILFARNWTSLITRCRHQLSRYLNIQLSIISSGEEAGQGQQDEAGRAQQQAGGRVALVLRTPAHITSNQRRELQLGKLLILTKF